MANKRPEIAQKIDEEKAMEEISNSIKQQSILNDLKFRLKEELYNVYCLWIRCAGYGVLILATLLIVLALSGLLTPYELFSRLNSAEMVFVFDTVKNEKIFAREFHIPFEVFVLLVVFIWRFSPKNFIKGSTKKSSK